MKRRILWFALGAVLLVVGLLAVVRLPATQRALLLRATAGVPGLEVQVRHVSAGFSAAEFEEVEARYEGHVVRSPRLRLAYSGWALLTRRELVVDELVATDLEVALAGDATGDGPAATGPAETAEVFAGFLAPLRLPVRATIDSVLVGGRVRLAASTTVDFSAQGRLLLPGQEAKTDLRLEWRDGTAGAAAKELDWVGRLATTAAADGMIERIQISGTLALPRRAAGAPEHGLATNLTLTGDGPEGTEVIEAAVRLSTAKETDAPLLKIAMRHRRASGSLEGDWTMELRREQLEGIIDLNALPDFSATANGSFQAAAASGDFTAEGEAALTAAKLQRWRREFAAFGALAGKVGFAAERRGRALRLSRLAVELGDGRGAGVKLEALQPIGYRMDTRAVEFSQPETDLLRLEVAGLPLAWARPWLGDTMLGGTISAGELRCKGAGSAWSVATVRPFALTNLSFGSGRKAVVDRVNSELAVRATVDGANWAVEVFDLGLRSAAGTPFDEFTLGLRASGGPEGQGRVSVPVTLRSGARRSDVSVEAEWAVAGAVKTVQARVQGDTVFVRDFGALAALIPSGPEAPAPAKTAAGAKAKVVAPVADREAFWAGVAGRVNVDLGRVVLETEELIGVRAALVCDSRQLALEQFSAKTKSGALEAKFGVTFDGVRSAPYALQGHCAFPGFDLGAWLRASNPAEQPAIETVLDVTAKVEGQGANLDALLGGVRGDFVLKGGPGTLRIKDKKVEAASALGGLVLGLLSKEKQQKPAVAAGAQLIEELREFRFDRLDVSLLRGDDLNLQLRTIDVRSAEKRLSGAGIARHVAGRTLDEYPLELEMRLAGKGNFGALLDQASLLDGSKDDLGYLRLRQQFTVTGTLAEPNWKKMLGMLGAGLLLGK